MDGWTAIRHIRASPKLANQYVIALTAHALKSSRNRCLEAGCDDYLSKPTAKSVFFETTGVWVEAGEQGKEAVS